MDKVVFDEGEIYLGDCRAVISELALAQVKVDMILTDPPYGLDLGKGGTNKAGDRLARAIKNDDAETADVLFEQFLALSKNVMREGAWMLCFIGGGSSLAPANWTLLLSKYIGFEATLVWDKISFGLGTRYRRVYELALLARNGDKNVVWNGNNSVSDILRYKKAPTSIDTHPTPKPVEMLRDIILNHTNVGELILDPFAGRMPTAIACAQTKRRFIMIEIDEEHFVKGVNRVKGTLSQRSLFDE